jgi:acyl-CoA reductase-like NAD-dependent aldehyde dehydrogenase
MTNQNVPEYGYYLGDRICREGSPYEVRACFDNSLVARVFRPSDEALAEALETASRAFRITSALPTHRRAEILRNISAGVESRSDRFARTLALEAGKPLKAARVEIERCVFNLRHASEEVARIESEFIPLDVFPGAEDRLGLVRRFPLGVILAITPFNFPLNLVAHKVAPAIASGNATVQKPASKTPICSLMLAEIAYEAGLPAGALSVLPCSGGQAERMVEEGHFQMLTFTGSSDVGWRLKSKVPRKKVTLELGGNAAVIIHGDADLEDAASRCVAGGFAYAGQSCIAVQRILVHASVFDAFLRRLVDGVNRLRCGDPLDEETDVGPMISLDDARRVEAWVDEAVAAGAEVVAGGRREDALYQPTVLTRTRPEMKVNCEEIFGPVVTVEPYRDFVRALAIANDSPYGLQAGIFTRDMDRVFAAYEALEVGGVVANDVPTFRADHMPYGGVKRSGVGREGARYAIEEMTERRILVLRRNPPNR